VDVAQLRAGCDLIRAAEARHVPKRLAARGSPTRYRGGLESVLFHAGLIDQPPSSRPCGADRRAQVEQEWAQVAPGMAATMRAYVTQCALTQRPSTVVRNAAALRELGTFVAGRFPEVTAVAALRRTHLEAYKTWLAERPLKRPGKGRTLHRASIRNRLSALGVFFARLLEWGSADAPISRLLFAGDLPILDRPLPRFLDDPSSAQLLRAARADDDPFVRLVVELLARTGMRKGELIRLTVDAVVQIGSAHWLRIPVGKLHSDRYIPLHPHLKTLLDAWLRTRPPDLRSDLLFVERGRPIGPQRVDRALKKVAVAAGIGHVTPHQLRHTLATQAINRGMSLEAIAALLGHQTLTMTMVYARIADRTVAKEYFTVSEKVEALYDQPKALPASAEGREMRKLRAEVHRRMLGNGYCARPVTMDCHFESICESCTFFVTTAAFRPTLERQRDDAVAKGQIGRQRIFEDLLARLDPEAS
jgi:integrase